MEFAVLRYTIASRGTARSVLGAVTVGGWAVVASAHALFSDLPLTSVVPLVVLWAGYEALWSVHVGIERIGRFLQVHYERPDGARWETTAMGAAPRLPGGGANPLASAVFAGAALVNLGVAFVAEPTGVELLLLTGCHAVFLGRLVQTRMWAARQRRSDLAAFEYEPPGRHPNETSPNTENS
jgi:hypothetical protein